MPQYVPLANRPGVIRFAVPSTPGGEIWGPGKLNWGMSKRIASSSKRFDENGNEQTDSTLWQDAVVTTWLEHPETGWNLFDADDRPLDRNRNTIDEVFDLEDIKDLSLFLTKNLFPEYYAFITGAIASAEGNEEDEAEETPPPSTSSDESASTTD